MLWSFCLSSRERDNVGGDPAIIAGVDSDAAADGPVLRRQRECGVLDARAADVQDDGSARVAPSAGVVRVTDASSGGAVKFGLHLPNFGPFGDAGVLAGLAVAAEEAGWDGFFLWDHLLFCDVDKNAHVDPWVALTAVAASTSRIMFGTLVTPVARRRPWELARQTVSLQNFSGGRLILGVGLGEPVEWDFRFFGDPTDAEIRAERLDEGLEILTGLWSGDQFAFRGSHYTLEPMTFLPRPSTPIPIWVGGRSRSTRPLRRAARYQGMVPMQDADDHVADLRRAVKFVERHRDSDAPFDVVVSGRSEPGSDSAREVGSYDGLATWWLEDLSPLRFGVDWPALADPWDVDALTARIHAGPVY